MPLWAVACAVPAVLLLSWWRWRRTSLNERALAARAALAAGDLARATALFESLRDRSFTTKIELARLYALRADLPRATARLADARRDAGGERGIDRAAAAARLVLVEVLIACRKGALDTAHAVLIREWPLFEAADGGGVWRAEACLVRGFLDAAAGIGVEVWLGLDEATRDRVRWMAAEWPELRAFLDAH